jgi:DNA-nicking Smr family endonuclease
MKKRPVPPEQAPADFRHNPFKALKGLTPAPAPAKKETPAPSRKKAQEKDEDAAALFLQAASGAKRIAPDENESRESKRNAPHPAKPQEVLPDDEQLFRQAMQKMGASFKDTAPEAEEPLEHRSASSRLRQLKRGTIRISQELDLHGFLKDEALARLGSFIASAHERGVQAVLVITGKGINSPEGPVLQGAVAEWLRTKGKAMVAEFAPAPRDKGGSGAFVVFLKKR